MSDSGNKEDWRRLFEAAIRFKKQGCWKWISDEDYFAVTNPETGEVGYCVVLGAGGMEFGLNVYCGPKAGAFLQEIMSGGQLQDDSQELMFNTNAVTVNFGDREELDKQDLALIRELGYKFRGSGEWPLFRSYEPGMIPWGLNGEQVRFLATALEQTIEVAERLLENPELYLEHDQQEEGIGKKRPHRVPQMTTNGIEWRDEWLPWSVQESFLDPYVFPDELRLLKLKKSLKRSNVIWESDFDYAPIQIGEKGQRAYYPRFCIWVNQSDGMILSAQIVERSDCREQYVEQLLALMESMEQKPAGIEVGSSKAYFALKRSAEKLDISLRQNPMLDGLLEAKEAIFSSL